MKGWKYESWRHSLAARGIKTRNSYSLFGDYRKWSEGYTQDKRSKLATGLTPTSAIVGKGQVDQLLMEGATAREKELIDQGKLKDVLREREARQALVADILEKYVQPKEGETFAQYLTRAKDYLSRSVDLNLKSAYGGPRFATGGAVVRTDAPVLTLADYVGFALETKFLEPSDQDTGQMIKTYKVRPVLNQLRYNSARGKFVEVPVAEKLVAEAGVEIYGKPFAEGLVRSVGGGGKYRHSDRPIRKPILRKPDEEVFF